MGSFCTHFISSVEAELFIFISPMSLGMRKSFDRETRRVRQNHFECQIFLVLHARELKKIAFSEDLNYPDGATQSDAEKALPVVFFASCLTRRKINFTSRRGKTFILISIGRILESAEWFQSSHYEVKCLLLRRLIAL